MAIRHRRRGGLEFGSVLFRCLFRQLRRLVRRMYLRLRKANLQTERRASLQIASARDPQIERAVRRYRLAKVRRPNRLFLVRS